AVLAECQRQWRSQLHGWSTGGDCAKVYGVRCDAAGFLVSMNVTDFIFGGPIPDALWNLTALTLLDLSFNKLNGSIPASLSRLSRLQELILTQNLFVGSIPSSILSLTKLGKL
ncbi:unnamed protein product, partial [Closterium sp. Yama58-4]